MAPSNAKTNDEIAELFIVDQRREMDADLGQLMWSLRTLMPRRSRWRAAQFDTLRLRLIKLAARIEVLKTKIRLHLPQATPDQALFGLLLTRMPRLRL